MTCGCPAERRRFALGSRRRRVRYCTLLRPPSSIGTAASSASGAARCRSSRELSFDAVAERLLVQNFIASPTPVFRRDAWIASGGLDESLWYTADLGHLAEAFRRRCGPLPPRDHQRLSHPQRFAHDDRQPQQRRARAADAHGSGRYLPRLKSRSQDLERAARASIAVNLALAAAAAGDLRGLWGALGSVLRLRPAAMRRFLRDTRLLERVAPRVLARIRGSL